MIKFGLKPAIATSLADGDNPIEQLETIIDCAKAARRAARLGDSLMMNPHASIATLDVRRDLPRSRFKVQGSTCSPQFKVSSFGFNLEP